MPELIHVKGKNVGRVILYALSTCVWCKKARNLLDELKIEYFYTYVDLLDSEENTRVKNEIRKWNSHCSFPTIVKDDGSCIVGFDEEKIRGLKK
ncbi:MAG: NrdH-redoxin [Spirochaetes bacterium RBG_13_51_14]|nr:MAG: NrdH-redoxin [Spirochaetes bacterium RBG_13_51_14]